MRIIIGGAAWRLGAGPKCYFEEQDATDREIAVTPQLNSGQPLPPADYALPQYL